MAVNRMFRTDPATGLVFHQPAEKLMRWNAVAAVVSLLVGASHTFAVPSALAVTMRVPSGLKLA